MILHNRFHCCNFFQFCDVEFPILLVKNRPSWVSVLCHVMSFLLCHDFFFVAFCCAMNRHVKFCWVISCHNILYSLRLHFFMLYCIVLHYILFYCILLYCIVLYCIYDAYRSNDNFFENTKLTIMCESNLDEWWRHWYVSQEFHVYCNPVFVLLLEYFLIVWPYLRSIPYRYESIIATLCENLEDLDEPEVR